MFDLRAENWQSLVRRNGPRLVSLTLAMLIAAELANAAIAFWNGRIDKSAQRTSGLAAPRRDPRGLDVERIVAAHLFGIAIDPRSRDAADARPTSANLVLNGTIATDDPKQGMAIISENGHSKTYSVGDDVAGATLHTVHLDHVVLSRGGLLETLSLPHVFLAGGAAPVREIFGEDSVTGLYLDNLGRIVDKKPGVLDKIMHTVGEVDEKSGKLRGFKVYPAGRGAPLLALGLVPGDLVTSINGTPIEDQKRVQELLSEVQASGQASATVERQMQTINVTLNVGAAAAELTNQAPVPALQTPSPTAPEGET